MDHSAVVFNLYGKISPLPCERDPASSEVGFHYSGGV